MLGTFYLKVWSETASAWNTISSIKFNNFASRLKDEVNEEKALAWMRKERDQWLVTHYRGEKLQIEKEFSDKLGMPVVTVH